MCWEIGNNLNIENYAFVVCVSFLAAGYTNVFTS